MQMMIAIFSLTCLFSFSYAFSFKNVSKDISRNAMQLLQQANAATSMKDMHYAVKLLRALNISWDREMCSSHCDSISAAFKQASSSLEVYFAYSAASSCGCSKVKFNAKAFAIIDEDLEVYTTLYFSNRFVRYFY